MTTVTIQEERNTIAITEDNNNINVTSSDVSVLLTAPGTQGPPRSADCGVIYLKANTITTPIDQTNGRAVVSGAMLTSSLTNFEKDALTNSLKYKGTNGLFHAIATFNFYSGSQDTCGFYIGVNRDASSPLDADADRISESEIYVNAGTPSNQPKNGTIQTLVQLTTDDRIFFIVQNKTKADAILVEFMKLIVKS
ncbi:hypothetical protein S-CBS4_gp052 [Synechococcus phage S-CBS4]|uniref:hypothetical protein n=1 Tax=Synechococcus phage S-CBS4 TaxID=756275 RepID=UPI000246A70C|nr:hypothetical protein S-CBS4_gp052 [Synechococcus phage S-CBS4]AEX56019.1 hypothetical protein S-CBS4_gp052 [Synechococcus phage S-CBS4]AGN30503.1 hypothetical protein SXAG_00056 [Synechococcus phage S-CBS4]